ncbi:hypothetical protein WMZ97_01160 [Lentibacillus sp. N15]|uniref:hypothetical protein n=1 Tax=Lentibacillus songyuanensis TaxID=3136161 RepID=UPI0031BB29C1
MKKILVLSSIILLCFMLVACEGEAKGAKKSNDSDEKKNVELAGYFTTNEVDVNGNIPILFVAKNDSNKAIKVTEDDFSLENKKEDQYYGVGMGERARILTVKAHEEAAIIFSYPVTSDETLETAYAKDFNIEYAGDLENVTYPLTLSDEVPAKYKEMAVEWNEEPEADEDESDWEDDGDDNDTEIVNGFEVQKRFKIAGYAMEERGRSRVQVNIRVENLTDEELRFDASLLKMYDIYQEYDLAPVNDSAFNPLMPIPPHGKVDYIEYYLLANDYDTDTEDVMAGILGFHYVDDQIMEKADVYGGYQKELPGDFSPE